ncbi:transcription factor NF-E2 45 kDa subunit-like [Danaus plexippus]|uniref:transcription factor NF-E2 45 kDa subunit-like n=1 Tax=Danaus plexippus TaxID=13037 RepID=UPI002AAFB7CA|nr:transcription factor NF-E2 45 kDa subunit-like [Danaus plexippus]
MDDIGKHAPSYQLDQDILNARGIDMTVEEVAGLPTCKYSDRVQSLNLSEDDLAFLKGLRRRIKNRLASQNSRRRSVEHLRRLTRELRALRACRDDALSERRLLLDTRAELRDRFNTLRSHVVQYLQERSDYTEVPNIDHTRINVDEDKTEQNRQTNRQIYECRLDKLVQQSVNHVYREKICAKTVFIGDEVLDLCVKKRSHGRKQPTPKKVAYCPDYDDGVLDLKVKKENQ